MQKSLLFGLLLLCSRASHTIAQSIFRVSDSITINNINAGVGVFGDMFDEQDISGGYLQPHCSFPAGARTQLNFSAALWLSGYDAGGQLHVAAQTYRQNGTDYWPGPLDGANALSYAESYKWGKIWKVNRSDIQAYQAMAGHTEINTLPAILTWPGKGNIYAKGNDGYALHVNKDMAPFVDVNGNGVYEPLAGDYPDIKGDQALWWVFNDNGPSHNESRGRPLGVEVHAMAYGYKRNTVVDNVLFYEYDIINRSANNFNNMRVAAWDDVEVGYYLDDYIGYDASHRMGIAYNAITNDGLSGGVPVYAYGTHVPITGLSMVSLPGDVDATYVPAGSFNMYVNDNGLMGIPDSDIEYDYYMRSKIRNGQHIRSTFGGVGAGCDILGPGTGTGSGPECDFLFPGDPTDPNQWSECQCGDVQGDRRFILSSGDFTLAAGASAKVALALVVSADAGGCGSVNFTDIKTVADTAWHVYHHPLQPNDVTAVAIADVRIYPNPARNELYIDDTVMGGGDAAIVVYNITGRKMSVAASNAGGRYVVDLRSFPAGVYHIDYTRGMVRQAATFVKE